MHFLVRVFLRLGLLPNSKQAFLLSLLWLSMGFCCSKQRPDVYTEYCTVDSRATSLSSSDSPSQTVTKRLTTESAACNSDAEPAGTQRKVDTTSFVKAKIGVSHTKSAMARMAPAVISPTARHSATVIFLHGLGDTGHGWCEEFKHFALPWIKYVFPHAPSQPVTLNGGMRMPSWFDIKGLSPDVPQDEDGIVASSNNLKSLIEQESKAVPKERILVGGFSQGGALALYTALTAEDKLAGVLAFSTWIPLHNKIMGLLKEQNKKIPVLQCHGDMDPVVPYAWGNVSAKFLQKLNPEHTIVTLPGVMHSGSNQEMVECKNFLAKVVPQIN